MPSPFPGMDPYLEDPAFWQDFHRSFITYCRDALLDKLPEQYEARIDEQVRLVEHQCDRVVAHLPDVAVTHDSRSGGATAVATRAPNVASIEPVTMEMAVEAEEVRDVWIEIRHRRDRALVTAIELLSPSNKTGVGYQEYRDKRLILLCQNAHLVEIDLLVGGKRLEGRPPLPRGDYYAYVSRAPRRPIVDVYAWSLRDPLPTIPVPLKTPDPDVGLDIAAVFATTYERGRYARSLRYDAPPPAPLDADTVTWARQRAAAAPKT
jgi:hypothetical protein